MVALKNKLSSRGVWMVGLVVIVTLLALVIIIINMNTRDSHNDESGLRGIEDYTKKLPRDPLVETYVDKLIDQSIMLNSGESELSLKDSEIRKNSFKQNFDENKKLYTARYIIDVPDAKVSFSVKYQWSNGDIEYDNSQLEVSVVCVEEKDLIYKPNECKSVAGGRLWESHKVFDLLPHKQKEFAITPYPIKTNRLIVAYYLAPGTKNVTQVTSEYKLIMEDWLLSEGLNPDDFSYEYRVEERPWSLY